MSTKPITDSLRLFQQGAFNVQCGELLAQVVKSVEETGKAGRLTIFIDIKKQGGALSVLPRVTDKTPEALPDPDLFWATVDGNLSQQNPNQRSLDLQAVPTPELQVQKLAP